MTLTLVVSDLHIAGGRSPDTGKWSPLDDFYADHAFAHLLAHHQGSDPDTHLVLNGDTFDLTQVVALPLVEELPAIIGSEHLDRDRAKYGLGHSIPETLWKIGRVAAGHRPFFEALAGWAGRGHHAHFVIGNHDVELRHPEIQARLIELVAGAQTGGQLAPDDVRPFVHFHDWYFYQPAQGLYTEHGNQYEPLSYVDGERMPACHFNNRYLFNLLEARTPEADNIIPLTRYISWLISTDTIPTLRILLCQMPDFLRARRKDDHRLPAEKPPHPRLPEAVEDAIRRAATDQRRIIQRNTRLTALFTAIAIFLNLVAEVSPLAAVALALTDRPVLAILALAAWPFTRATSVSTINSRLHRSLLLDISFLEDAARQLASTLAANQVTTVAFGHTHQPDLTTLPHGLSTFNTGTWMPLFSDDSRLERQAQACLYLEVRDGQSRLLNWHDVARRGEPPIIIDRQSSPRYATRWLSPLKALVPRRDPGGTEE